MQVRLLVFGRVTCNYPRLGGIIPDEAIPVWTNRAISVIPGLGGGSNASIDAMLDAWSIELIGILDIVIPDATGNVTTQPPSTLAGCQSTHTGVGPANAPNE